MGVRDENRAATTAKILAAARGEIARVGGVGLSMREVARQSDLVSSAVYRYFPTREDLLTAMVVDSYSALAAALGEVKATGAAYERWYRLAHALRDWAKAHPHEFQLVYGTPIPGYVAPSETISAAEAVARPFFECVGRRKIEVYFGPALTDGVDQLARALKVAPSTVAAVTVELSALVGFVSHELSGHFVGLDDSGDGFFGHLVRRQIEDLDLA